MHTSQERAASSKRVHKMPFGCQVSPQSVTFRLWAPTSQKVELVLLNNGSEQTFPMHKNQQWHELVCSAARPGMDYKFKIDGDLEVPDPCSRYQPADVHGASRIIDPAAFSWQDSDWQGRPWTDTTLYELHVGTFSQPGNFAGVIEKLDYLKDLGVTAIELMPVADFPGSRGWGYDGVLPFAPESSYGTPNDLKQLVQTAHQKGLMVFLDVVYNHFGPEGNYLHCYAKSFFTDKHKTPWGAAIDFENQPEVRRFFIENALYWLEEFNFDGLRLDAVHAIKDDSSKHILIELAEEVKNGPGRQRERHLVLENEDNTASFLARDEQQHAIHYHAQWNDDIHHAYHVVATDEKGGYYADYAQNAEGKNTIQLLHRALTEGFIYQGDPSLYRDSKLRGEPSDHLPPQAFVSFLQNHDQIGNRAFGDRLAAISPENILEALVSIELLAPAIPLIFMGEEWGAKTPFYYFCDLGEELAPLITEGRRNEFAKFPEFAEEESRASIPDPCAQKTFLDSKLVWQDLNLAPHQRWYQLYEKLLKLRRHEICPILPQLKLHRSQVIGNTMAIAWQAAKSLCLLANLAAAPAAVSTSMTAGQTVRLLHATAQGAVDFRQSRLGQPGKQDEAILMSAWSVIWLISE